MLFQRMFKASASMTPKGQGGEGVPRRARRVTRTASSIASREAASGTST